MEIRVSNKIYKYKIKLFNEEFKFESKIKLTEEQVRSKIILINEYEDLEKRKELYLDKMLNYISWIKKSDKSVDFIDFLTVFNNLQSLLKDYKLKFGNDIPKDAKYDPIRKLEDFG